MDSLRRRDFSRRRHALTDSGTHPMRSEGFFGAVRSVNQVSKENALLSHSTNLSKSGA